MILFSDFSAAQRKSLSYFGMLILVLLLLELLFNFFAVIFSNTTNTIRLKSAMFSHRAQTEILFLGSSRFSDGVSAKIFREQLEHSGETLKAFNGGITGATMERLEYFFDNAIEKDGIQHIVIEISRPQLKRIPLDVEADNEDIDKVETELTTFFEKHSKLVRWRKSLCLDNLKNAPIILFSNHLEGSELFRRGGFSDLMGDEKTTVDAAILKTWQPLVIEPNTLNVHVDEIALNAHEERINAGVVDYAFMVSIFKEIVEKAARKNIKITLVVPPLVNKSLKKEHNKEFSELYQALANETGFAIYDFTTIKIPETYFRDKDSHLNKVGRGLFSAKLAELMISQLHKERMVDVVQ